MTVKGRSCAIVFILALTSCNLAPQYSGPALPNPAPAFKETGPWTPARPGGSIGAADWWSVMNDKQLSALEMRVAHSNPRLQAAIAQYDQARAMVNRARAEFFPEIDAISSVQRERALFNRAGTYFDYRDYAAGGAISWEPDIWGRIRNLAAAAKSDALASADDVGALELSLEAELGEDYFKLRGLDARIEVLRQTAIAYQVAFRLTATRFVGGAANELDVSRSKTQLASVEAELDQCVANRALFEHAIATLIGEEPATFEIAPSPTPGSVPIIPVTSPSRLVERRPDVAAAERRIAAANARIGVARAAFFPNITLSAAGGSQTTLGTLLSAGTGVWALGPAMATLAIFDGGRRLADLQSSHAAFAEAAANYRQVVLNSFREVEDQLALLNHLAEAADRQAEAVTGASRTSELAMIQYREGAVDYLQVVVAQTTELRAREAAVAITAQRLVAAINLVRATGGGWDAVPKNKRT